MDRNAPMNFVSQKLCAWCGAAVLLGFAVGILLAGFLPYFPRADATPSEVVALYSDGTNRLRAAFVIMMIAGAFMGPFAVAVSMQLKRIEGRIGPMALSQLSMGAANAAIFSIGAMVMLVAAFRPDRNPDVLQGLNDLAWFFFVVWFAPLMLQMLSIAVAILTNPGQTVYPRWLGYLNLWTALGNLAGIFPPFFKSGAFAWHGLFGIWTAAVIIFVWLAVMTLMTLRAIDDEAKLRDRF